jgi:hypothetical protein
MVADVAHYGLTPVHRCHWASIDGAGIRNIPVLAALDNDWKLVRNFTRGEAGAFELYNVVGDPSGSNNLIKQRSATTERMMKELMAWDAGIDIVNVSSA